MDGSISRPLELDISPAVVVVVVVVECNHSRQLRWQQEKKIGPNYISVCILGEEEEREATRDRDTRVGKKKKKKLNNKAP
jgi:hypothetical protein